VVFQQRGNAWFPFRSVSLYGYYFQGLGGPYQCEWFAEPCFSMESSRHFDGSMTLAVGGGGLEYTMGIVS
jgi:hypothetical protein